MQREVKWNPFNVQASILLLLMDNFFFLVFV